MATPNSEAIHRGWSHIFRRLLTSRLVWFMFGVAALLLLNSIRVLAFPAPLEPGELVILSGTDDSVNGQREQLLQEWNSLHPDNRAIFKPVPGDADAQHSAMVSQAQAGDSTVDIYNLDVTWVAEFAQARYIRPLDSVKTDGFLARPLGTCTVDGTVYALPFNTDAGLLYYRTDVLASAELPAEMPPSADAMRGIAQKDAALTAGYAMQLGDYEGLTVNALESIWAAGGDVIGSNGQVTIDSDAVRTGLQGLARALHVPAGQKPGIWPGSISGPDGRGGREKDSTNAFASGTIALMRNWPVAYGQLLHPPDRLTGPGIDVSTHFAVTSLRGPSVLGGQDLAIAGDSRKPRAAQALIEFLTSSDSEKQLFRDGALPATRIDAYSDAAVRAAQPYAPVLLATLNNAKLRPVTPHYPLFSVVFQGIVNDALSNDGVVASNATRLLTNALNGRLE
jgi:ABC-type glycerol-3-phosphate transport system substrate-binding protein